MTPRPHNPAGLTAEQIGTAEGWRLLDEDEIKWRSGSSEIWAWSETAKIWQQSLGIGWGGCLLGFTYRTKLTRAELAQLP